jgi:predicted glycosyltransferase
VLFQVRNRRGLGHLMRARNIGTALRTTSPHLDLHFHASARPAVGLWDPALACTSDDESSWAAQVAQRDPAVVVYDTVLPGDPGAGFRRHTKSVFVMRRQLDERSAELFAHPFLAQVERVIVPHTCTEFGHRVPAELAAKTTFVGTIARRPDPDARQRMRDRLGLDADALLLTSTVGGGGFRAQADRFFEIVETVGRRVSTSVPGARHVVVLGPNYTNAAQAAALREIPATIVLPSEPGLVDLLAASDLVIAEGGYNTVNEVRLSQAPAVFLPSQRGLDDQVERVAQLERLGVAHAYSPDTDPATVAEQVTALLSSRDALPAMRARYAGDRLTLGNQRAAELIAAVAS